MGPTGDNGTREAASLALVDLRIRSSSECVRFNADPNTKRSRESWRHEKYG